MSLRTACGAARSPDGRSVEVSRQARMHFSEWRTGLAARRLPDPARRAGNDDLWTELSPRHRPLPAQALQRP
ncbi:hypothetical protein ABTB76_19165, partial [Acinetobacter baumannii]